MNQMASTTGRPPSWEEHLQTLHRHFFENASDQCLLWVNPAQWDPFAENALVEECKIRVPIVHPRFDAQFAPYLVPLTLSNYADADLFNESVQMAWDAWSLDHLLAFSGQPICGWVNSKQSPKALARYWADQCHIHVSNGLEKLLRFHDPGVREWLWPLLSVSQQQKMLGSVHSMIAFDRQQNLMLHTGAIENGVAFSALLSNETTPRRLMLTSSQWEQVDDFATVHAAWLECCTMYPGKRAEFTKDKTWLQGIFAALRHASTYEINDTQDRALFARHAMQLGRDFYRNEKMQSVWPRTLAGDFYGGAVEEVFGHPADQLYTIFFNK